MRKKKFQISSPQTLREKIADSIREAIVKGTLKPGERVSEPELAERFGISRTPIREAIRQLESEGFLTAVPRKGAVVSPITEKDVKEFYAIKGVLEGYAARVATSKLTQRDITRMKTLNEQLERYAQEGDVKNLFKAHNEFHEIFVKACGNERLYQLTKNLVQQFQRFRIALSIFGGIGNSLDQHNKIIDAFEKRDPDLVSKMVWENARRGGEFLITEIRKEATE